jgi:carbon storage regulator CsrA
MLNLTRRAGEAIIMRLRDQKAVIAMLDVDHSHVRMSFEIPKTMSTDPKESVITRRIGEKVTIRWCGYKVVLKVMQLDCQVKMAFDAPKEVIINREEIDARLQAEGKQSL